MSESRLRSLSLLAAGVMLSGAAMAQSKTWTLNDTTAPAVCSQTTAGNSKAIGNAYSCQQQQNPYPNNLVVSAWSGSSSSNYATAAVTPQGGNGYGVGNVTEDGKNATSSNGDHSVDNGGKGGIDALLLKFTSGAEALTQVTVGWTGSDGDFQILRWTGGTPANDAALFSGKKTTNLVAAGGWELVSMVNLTGGIDTPDKVVSGFNNNNLTSSYWLLSAYNSGFGASCKGTLCNTATTGVDQLKFAAVGTTTATPNQQSSAPEPTSLALVAVALVGGAAVRRRRHPVERG